MQCLYMRWIHMHYFFGQTIDFLNKDKGLNILPNPFGRSRIACTSKSSQHDHDGQEGVQKNRFDRGRDEQEQLSH